MYTIPGTHIKFKDSSFIPVTLPYYDGIYNVYNDEKQRQYAVQYEANLDSASGIVDGVGIVSNPATSIFDRGVPNNINNEVEFSRNNTVMITQPNLLSEENYYAGYYIRFLTGDAAGVVRKITASATNGDAQDILTLTLGFLQIVRQTTKTDLRLGLVSRLQETANAAAFGSLDLEKRLQEVVVYNKGSGYSDATAVIDNDNGSASF